MDTGTGLTILGSAVGSAKVVEKILGPTADYLGDEIKTWTEKGFRNIANIFASAEKKLGEGIEDPGSVSPRVLKGILAEGYFCDSHIGSEYFGGVLASSRTLISRDDRGCALIALLSRLSSYQLRTHYIFYSAAKKLIEGREYNIGLEEVRRELQIFIPWREFVSAMNYSADENKTLILRHAMDGLAKESLIGDHDTWAYGTADFLNARFSTNINATGIVFTISALGVELYQWAHGYSDRKIIDFGDKDFDSLYDSNIQTPESPSFSRITRKEDDQFWMYGNSPPNKEIFQQDAALNADKLRE